MKSKLGKIRLDSRNYDLRRQFWTEENSITVTMRPRPLRSRHVAILGEIQKMQEDDTPSRVTFHAGQDIANIGKNSNLAISEVEKDEES